MFGKFASAASAALALSFVPPALPAFAQDAINPATSAPQVYFDLGIDVTKLPQNPADARSYFAGQSPETQRVLLASCRNYINHPADAAMPETLVFCTAIGNGPARPIGQAR